MLLGTRVWLEQPGEVEDGGVVHEGVEPRHLHHTGPHVVLRPDVKLLPEVDLVKPALLPAHGLTLPHSIGLEQVHQVEKLLLI